MMKTRVAFRCLALVLPVLLAGCGLFDFEEREPWRAQAEAACFSRGEVKLSSLIQKTGEIDGKGTCGLDRPLKVTALADGQVRLGNKALVISCPMTAALERWVRDAIMPAAYQRYGVPVVEIRSMGTYNCRSRNNVPGARLSEHAFANAFDFSGVVLANGYVVTVKKGWRGAEADRAFMRQIHAGACGPFSTVLGPGSDGLHEDHLHLDLARHNAKGTYRYCRPKPVMPDATDPPMVMVNGAPDAGTPVPTDLAQSWPKVLPQSIAAADANAGLPVEPVYPRAAPALRPATPQPMTGQPLPPVAEPACPPGYICTPVDPAAPPVPPAVGWSVGPQPIQSFTEDDYTGSVPYSDE